MEQRLSVITLGVKDLDRSRRFYEQGLGWRVGEAQEQIVFFQLNGLILGLYPRGSLAEDAQVRDEATGFSAVTLAYCAHSRQEVDAVLACAGSAGGHITKQAQEVFWGGYSGYFADPDGHLWEVAHNPFWKIDESGNISLESP